MAWPPAGWITLAATLTRYADRADQILATTIYPAIVRVRERARRARGAVREGQPADADVGVPVRRRPGAVRRRPDRVRARRRVARRDRAAGRDGGRGRAAAGRLQLVRVLPGARRVLAAGRRVRGVRRRVRRVGRAGRAARRVVGVRGGRVGCTACVLRGAARVRAAAAAGRAAVRAGAAGGACRSRSRRRRCWRCGWRCGAGSGRSGRRCSSSRLWLGGLALATRRLESGLLAELRGYLRAGGRRRESAARGSWRRGSPRRDLRASRCAATSGRSTRAS